MGNGRGARDQDPISILLLIFMGFVTLEWLSNGAFSPIPSEWQGSNICSPQSFICYGNIATDFNKVVAMGTPFLIIAVPLAIVMFAYYLMRELSGRDPKDYFETEIMRSRAMVTESDRMQLEQIGIAESTAQTRAQKNAAIAEYNAKVDEINARRARALRDKITPSNVPVDSKDSYNDKRTAEYNAEVEEENKEKTKEATDK